VNYAADTCRVMRELEAVKQEALMLQEQMKTIKYDIQKVLCVCFFNFEKNDMKLFCLDSLTQQCVQWRHLVYADTIWCCFKLDDCQNDRFIANLDTFTLTGLLVMWRLWLVFAEVWESWWHSGLGVGLSILKVVVGLIPGRCVIKEPYSTQPSIPPGYLNRVPAFTGWG